MEVEVVDTALPSRLNFERDVEPLLSRFGCNASSCHGKAEGQNGFKLSVFGYDPAADYEALMREGRGRRVFPAAPDHSLLLRKVSGASPHGGGVRIDAGSGEFRLLRNWIAAGMRYGDAADPMVERIEVSPRQRIAAAGSSQQLRVVATRSDGRRIDVTRLAQFQSNNALARVDERGLVQVGKVPGHAAVMARYAGAVDVYSVLIPRRGPKVDESGPLAGIVW